MYIRENISICFFLKKFEKIIIKFIYCLMEEKDEEDVSIINNDSKSSQINQEESTTNSTSFSISPQKLSNLINLYKERSKIIIMI
jgi:hypothetical protein